jgi:hypothetical protein
LNVNNLGNTKHTGNAQTPPRGDKTDDVLSPASHRQTDLFDWGSPTSGVVLDIIVGTPTPQTNSISGPGATRRRVNRDGEVPDGAYEYTNAERTSPSQPITTAAHGVPEGLINPFHIGWEKNKIWTPITGWIGVMEATLL